MAVSARKALGQFYTPAEVAESLVSSVVRSEADRLLDPACGDGQFLRYHRACVGVEVSATACLEAREAAPWARIHNADFFRWAAETAERFECVVGNPPFIRYQRFSGATRRIALELSRRAGANLPALTSSWAPFVAVSALLLKPGGRMAFVVPAEIGHAGYGAPLLEALCRGFERVRVVAIRRKLFPELSEDAWLLIAEGRGGRADAIGLTVWERFRAFASPPRATRTVSLRSWLEHGRRLRKFILPDEVLAHYKWLCDLPGCVRFGDIATIGVGYVTGANDFFHLRPSEARFYGVPEECLRPAIRKAEQLPERVVDRSVVERWAGEDRPFLLLDLAGAEPLPAGVKGYLESPAARKARKTYKCRNRRPWYVVPDVVVPDAFVSYMSGLTPRLVLNEAGCVCTNSLHCVRFNNGIRPAEVLEAWGHPLCRLSIELEGHPLGGGMLKLEPREAANVVLPMGSEARRKAQLDLIERGIEIARQWRHYGGNTRPGNARHSR